MLYCLPGVKLKFKLNISTNYATVLACHRLEQQTSYEEEENGTEFHFFLWQTIFDQAYIVQILVYTDKSHNRHVSLYSYLLMELV